MKMKDFYRINPNDWLFLDNADVAYSKERAIKNSSSCEYDNEEFVRQWVLRELIDTYKYPIEWIGERLVIEEPIKMGVAVKECDIAIKNSGRRPYLLLETKNAGISDREFEEAKSQLESYLAATHTATIGLVTNGRKVVVLEKKIDPNDFNIISDIPAFDKEKVKIKRVLTREIIEENGIRRKTGLKPLTERLNSILFECHSIIRDIDGLHDDEALDELSKIIFTKIYDEREVCRKEEGTVFKFQTYGAGNNEEVASNIRQLYEDARDYDLNSNSQKIVGYARSRGVFKNQIRLSSNALSKVVEHLQEYSFIDTTDSDIKGKAFQKVLGAAIRAGMGQYFTPHQIVELIVKMLDPKPSDLILDPFCGSGHFLSTSLKYIEDKYGKFMDDYSRYDLRFNRLHGIEKSDRMVRIAMTDMMLHDDGHTNIRNTDALLSFDNYPDIVALGGEQNEDPSVFTKIMTNTPFGSIMQGEIGDILGRFQLGKRKKSLPLEYLGLERCIQFLKPGGIMAIVLPDGLITNKNALFARNWVMTQAKIKAVISLPIETFAPYGTYIKTSILILEKIDVKIEKITFDYPVFMANIEKIGYDGTGRPIDENDIPYILESWEQFKEHPEEFISNNDELVYKSTGEQLKFRWDFAAGKNLNLEGEYTLFSEYADVIRVTENVEKNVTELYPYISIDKLPEDPYKMSNKDISKLPGNKLKGPKHIARGGDILFARLGPSMRNKKSLLLDNDVEKVYCSNEFHVLRPRDGVTSESILYLIKSDSFISQGNALSRGATPSRLRLYAEDLINIQVPKLLDEELKNKGKKYIEGRERISKLEEQVKEIMNDISPDF